MSNLFSYHADTPTEVRIASRLWLFPTVFSVLAIPYIIIEDLGTKLLLYTIFIGISSFLISYGLSHLKRWSIYLFGALMAISLFIIGGTSILFSLHLLL